MRVCEREINNFPQVAESVHAAIDEAEKMSGTTVDSIYLAQSGSHLKGRMLQGSSYVPHPITGFPKRIRRGRKKKPNFARLKRAGNMYISFKPRFFWTVKSGRRIQLGWLEKNWT